MFAKLLAFLLIACQVILNESSDVEVVANQPGEDKSTFTRTANSIPDGYTSFPDVNAAYKIHMEDSTWWEARDRCLAEGGRLAVTDSLAKIAHINSMKTTDFKWLHVGIYKLESLDKWVRADTNETLTHIPWTTNNPDGTGNCAGISVSDDGLVDYACEWGDEHYVCEIIGKVFHSTKDQRMYFDRFGYSRFVIKIIINAFLLKFVEGTNARSFQHFLSYNRVFIPDGYLPFPQFNVFYKLYEIPVTWLEARDYCSEERACLVIADNIDKISAITSMRKKFGKYIHVGIYMPPNRDHWIRIDTDAPVEKLPWATGQPDGEGLCVGIDGDDTRNGHDEGLIDYPCGRTMEHFACEIPF